MKSSKLDKRGISGGRPSTSQRLLGDTANKHSESQEEQEISEITTAGKELGWNLEILKNKYVKYIESENVKNYQWPEAEYERATWAFHVGVKIFEHWDDYMLEIKTSTFWRNKDSFEALMEYSEPTNPFQKAVFPHYMQASRFSMTSTKWKDIPQERKNQIIDDIRAYTSKYKGGNPNVFSEMSLAGKRLLKEAYDTLISGGEVDKRALKRIVTKGFGIAPFVKEIVPKLEEDIYYLLRPEDID